MRQYIQVEARWVSHHQLEAPEGADPEELARRIDGGDLDLLVALGDVDSSVAELTDFSART